MKDIRIACFSDMGERLGRELCLGEVTRFPGSIALRDWTEEGFGRADALIYIGACAIAVRAIAPFLKSKLSDPAVIAMDETGAFVIPVLSGHIGGANALAQQIADRIRACPVITTATDRRRTFAADSWAVENGFGIVNPEAVKSISSSVLQGEEIVLSVRKRGGRELRLVPRNIVLGAGCRKGTDPAYMKECFSDFCRKHEIEPASVGCLASVDLKSEENALLRLAAERNIPFLTYTAQELMSVAGTFTVSDFVLRTTGTDNVCERAAMRACEDLQPGDRQGSRSCGELICRKEIYEGVTLAAARMKITGSWEWI